MNYEQMALAIKALAPSFSIMIRAVGDWYASAPGVEIGDGHMLAGASGNGKTPEAAVEDLWQKLRHLPAGKFIATNAMGPGRAHYRWNGFMWEPIPIVIKETA